MGYIQYDGYLPNDNTTVTNNDSVTISFGFTYGGPPSPPTGGITRLQLICFGVVSDAVQTWSYSPPQAAVSESVSRRVASADDVISWYVKVTYYDGTTITWDAEIRDIYFSDTAAPTISGITPSESSAKSPSSSGVYFSFTASDAFDVASKTISIDGTQRASSTGPGTISIRVDDLAKGAHSWVAYAEDASGNSDSVTPNFTVVDVPPTDPGPISVASPVAQGGEVSVSWGASTDNNSDDTPVYQLQEAYLGGAYSTVALWQTSTSFTWTPTTAGTAYLRVRTSSGGVITSYVYSDAISVVAVDPPNAPTITDPGGETWREGDTKSVAWSEASPLDPAGYSVTYEGEYSLDGTFTDAVSLFSGVASGVTSDDWYLDPSLIAADTATVKVRIRARNQFDEVSAWSTSTALTIEQNTYPTVSMVTPTDMQTLTDRTPAFTVDVADVDLGDLLHVEIEYAEIADFTGAVGGDLSLIHI